MRRALALSAAFLSLAALAAAAGCGSGAAPEPPAAAAPAAEAPPGEPAEATEPEPPTEDPAPATEDLARCLPIVSGCGCVFACATGEPVDGRPSWRATFGETTQAAQLRRTCFTPDGAIVEEGAPGAECVDAFLLAAVCGGGCVADPTFVRCAFDAEGACGPAQPSESGQRSE